MYKGKTVASHAGERNFVGLIDYTQAPSGNSKYVMPATDVLSRHDWAKAMTAHTGTAITQAFKSLAADIGTTKELNCDAEFEHTKALHTCVGSK